MGRGFAWGARSRAGGEDEKHTHGILPLDISQALALQDCAGGWGEQVSSPDSVENTPTGKRPAYSCSPLMNVPKKPIMPRNSTLSNCFTSPSCQQMGFQGKQISGD